MRDYVEKFNFKKHEKLTKNLPFSYVSLPIYLDFCAYTFNRNGEDLLVIQDPLFPHDFPSLFLPKNPLNWRRASMSMLSKEEVEKVRKANIRIEIETLIETEFFYRTKDFLEPKLKLKSKIGQFKKSYSYKIVNQYSKEKIKKFYHFWEKQKKTKSDLFEKESTKLFFFCLEKIDHYDIKQIYIEVNGKLVGFAWGTEYSDNKWVGLHLKSDYQYKGLGQMLHHERAKLFPRHKIFSAGTGCQDQGIIQFKKELGPFLEKDYYYLFTWEEKDDQAFSE
jgi:hypothetical protein